MKSIGQLLPKKETKQSKHKFYWQEQAEEVSLFFGKSLYWMFHKFPADAIYSEFKYRRDQNNRDIQGFVKAMQWKRNQKQI